MQQGQYKNQNHCNCVDGSNRMAFAAAVATSTTPAAALALLSTIVGVAVADDATDVTLELGTELDIGKNDFEIAMDSWNQSNGYDNHSNLLKIHGAYNNLSHTVRVNPFWLEFPPPSTEAFHMIAIIYIIIMVIGCFGNAFVIFMFIRFKSLRTQANVLVINLAISDFFMLAKCPIAIYNSFKEGPALGDWGCRMYGFLGGLTGTTSIITLTAIAIDRYKVVVHPLDSIRFSSKIRIRCTLTFIWFYSFAFSVIPALDIGLSIYVPEGFLTTCGFDYLDRSLAARIFMFVFFVGAWCVPFGIIVYCYMYILKVVCSGSIRSSKDKFKTEIKLTVIVLVIIWLWFLAWTPYSIVALLGITGNENKLTPLASMIPAIFCKSSACIDPYIYAATHPRFRMELRRLVHGGVPVRRSSTMRSSVISRSTTSKRLRKDCISDVQNRNGMTTNQGKLNMSIIEENDESEIYLEQQDSDIEQSRF